MREIKFRAWDKEMKILSPVGRIDFEKSALIYQPIQTDDDGNVDWTGYDVPLERLEIMQFVGLKTISKQEIYEGDIVTYRCGNCIKEHRLEIVWIPDIASWGVKDHLKKYSAPITVPIDEDDLSKGVAPIPFERVLGNIYQNADLLK